MPKPSNRDPYKAEQWFLWKFEDIDSGAELTANSGAKYRDGDIKTKALCVEVKSTKNRTYSVAGETMHKMQERARHNFGKDAILVVVTEADKKLEDKNAYAVLPWELAMRLLPVLHEEPDEQDPTVC